MFYFCPYRGLGMFSLFGRVIAAVTELFDLRRSAFNFVPDPFALFIPYNCILALFRAQITAVPVNLCFFAGQQFCSFAYIVHIGRGYIERVNKPTIFINTNMCVVSKMPGVAFLGGMCLRITLFLLVFGRR